MARQKDVEAMGKPTGNELELTELRYSPFTHNALVFIAAALGSTSKDRPSQVHVGLTSLQLHRHVGFSYHESSRYVGLGPSPSFTFQIIYSVIA
jgi:hypothetical protein